MLKEPVALVLVLMQLLELKFKKKGGEHAPIYINGTEVERVKSITFLRVTITGDLSWTSHIDVTVKKAQQHLFFLRQLRKFGMSIGTLTDFYRRTIERILSGCITAWYGNCSAQDHKKLQKVVCTVHTITEANLPSMEEGSFLKKGLGPKHQLSCSSDAAW
eukprot:g24811.t1